MFRRLLLESEVPAIDISRGGVILYDHYCRLVPVDRSLEFSLQSFVLGGDANLRGCFLATRRSSGILSNSFIEQTLHCNVLSVFAGLTPISCNALAISGMLSD